VATTVSDYIKIVDRAFELGCTVPQGIGVLPENFETAKVRSELLVRGDSTTISTLLRNGGIESGSFLPLGERVSYIHNKSFDWSAAIFISAALLSDNPGAISVGLGILSNYLTDFFKGMRSSQVKLTVVVEKKRDRTCKRIDYEGDPEGLKGLYDTIRRIADE